MSEYAQMSGLSRDLQALRRSGIMVTRRLFVFDARAKRSCCARRDYFCLKLNANCSVPCIAFVLRSCCSPREATEVVEPLVEFVRHGFDRIHARAAMQKKEGLYDQNLS